MKFDRIEFIARASASLVDADGIRSGSATVVENLTRVVAGRFAFLARRRRDSDIADILAASGLGVADFRRLEERISKSVLWKMLHLTSPFAIDPLGGDHVLNFLSFGTGAQSLLAVPVTVRGSSVGLLAVGFPGSGVAGDTEINKFLNAIAAVFAQAVRAERTISEEGRKLAEENLILKQELKEKYDFHNLIGNSSPMRQVFDLVSHVARSNATVLLRGESGTGKELIANAIHYNSLRSKRPFVVLNCSGLNEALVELELFGDGSAKRKGRLEQADGGTLLLDEIGDLSLATQAKLLRVIENREIERPGGELLPLNVRLIASTAKDLEAEIAREHFREDLYYRLNMFPIYLPPLRERKSDILLLAEHFLERLERKHQKHVRRISTPAIDMLTAYHFPGNVRELENVIERAMIVCDSNVIHGHHLPPTLQTAELSGTETRVTLTSAVEAFERDLIQDTLKSTGGNVARAAKMLDSTERILGYKIKKYGVDPKRYRR
ncbi:MAG: sigma 54-interacting transcriptional regulator [Acidobacteriota bacterium]